VAEPSAFSSVPLAEASDVRSLYLELTAVRRGTVRAFRTEAMFQDIGTPADYLQTCLQIASAEGVDLAAHARVAPTARIERTVLWEDVVVEDGATVRECVVTDGVHIPAGSSWHRVSIRRATGDLAQGEERRDGLAVAAL